MRALILLVEDEVDLAAPLAYRLNREGFDVRTATTGAEALNLAAREPTPDLVLLDLMLPDISGKEVCRRLRADPATTATPIIMLTARGEEVDRVVGFEVGADDYVVKPYSVRELLLRIQAVLRRAGAAPSPEARSSAALRFGALTVDPAGHRVWVSDQEVGLTALEFKLLVALMERRGRVQSRDRLLEDVWGYAAGVSSRTVDTHVKRLREKLGVAGAYVGTLRGVGYRFQDRLEGHD